MYDRLEVIYAELDHRSLNRLHAHSCTQPANESNGAIVFFLTSLSLYGNVGGGGINLFRIDRSNQIYTQSITLYPFKKK